MRKMTKEQWNRKCEELNQAMLQWKALERAGEDYSVARTEVFLLSFELFDGEKNGETGREYDPNAFLEAFNQACLKFDPDKGVPFSGYLGYINQKKQLDAYRRREKYDPKADALDAPIQAKTGESGITLGDVVPDTKADVTSVNNKLVLSESILHLTEMVLNFSEKHRGKTGNEEKRQWYRLFFTEDITLVAKEGINLPHQRDIFRAMEETYLSYYMVHPCASMEEIERTRLKKYGETVDCANEEMQDKQTPVPLPADVSLAYLKRVQGKEKHRSARSNQYKTYKEEREALYSC